MSRVGKKPIPIPAGVDVSVTGNQVTIKGPKGQLQWPLEAGLTVAVEGGQAHVKRAHDDRRLRAMHGLTRANLSNMMVGVTKGYERVLEMTGVGYKAQLQGKVLSLNVGYINPVEFQLLPGVDGKVEKQTQITLAGIDKRLVGELAAKLRGVKPPDVYKQKGIRYAGEVLRKKEGKTGK